MYASPLQYSSFFLQVGAGPNLYKIDVKVLAHSIYQ